MLNRITWIVAMCIVTGLAMVPVHATAETDFQGIHPLMKDRFVIGAGVFRPRTDTKVRLDSSAGDAGTVIDLEDTLGLDDTQNLFIGSVKWRITDRFHLAGQYFQLGHDNQHSITERIDWGDLDFEVGANVKTEFDLSTYRIFFGYSFLKNSKGELGAGIGAHIMDADATLSGAATVDGVPVASASESISGTAPLPNIGIYGGYAFSPKWFIGANVDWLSAEVGDFDGTLWGLGGFVQYQAFKHVGIGIGYQYFSLDVDADRTDWKGSLDFSYHGPLLFATVNF